MRETWVWPLGWEDLLAEGMATHSSVLAWGIPWTKKPGRIQSTGSQRVRHSRATKHSLAHIELDRWTDSLSRDHRCMSIHIYICMKRLIIGIGSGDYDLPSTSWRPRRASGIIQSNSKGLRTRNINVQGQGNSTAHFKQRASSPLFHLCHIQALNT